MAQSYYAVYLGLMSDYLIKDGVLRTMGSITSGILKQADKFKPVLKKMCHKKFLLRQSRKCWNDRI